MVNVDAYDFSPAIREQRAVWLSRFREDDRVIDLVRAVAPYRIRVHPVYQYHHHRVSGYWVGRMFVGGHFCGLYEANVPQNKNGTAYWTVTLAYEQIKVFDFVILKTTDSEEDVHFFVLPIELLLRRYLGKSYFKLHIPVLLDFPKNSAGGRKPLFKWAEYKNAFGRLKVPVKQKTALAVPATPVSPSPAS